MQPMQTNAIDANQFIYGSGPYPNPYGRIWAQARARAPSPTSWARALALRSHRKRALEKWHVIYKKLYAFLCLFILYFLDPLKRRIGEI